MWLAKIFNAAVPSLTVRSVLPLSDANDPDTGLAASQSSLVIKNYSSLKEDLQVLNKLMHIARNLLVTTEPVIPQDICAAALFNRVVYQTIALCVNVAGKGLDREVDVESRKKLNEITDLCMSILRLRPKPRLSRASELTVRRQEAAGDFSAAGPQLDCEERPEQDVVLARRPLRR